MSHDRFFLDHGAIHDRMTGKHVGMQAEIDWQPRLLSLLNDMWEQITSLERAGLKAARPEPQGWMERAAREAEADILRCFYVVHTVGGEPQHDIPPSIQDGEIRWHIEKSLASHAPKAVPGWKLVPVEPTEEMKRVFNLCAKEKYPCAFLEMWEWVLRAAPPEGMGEEKP